MKKIYSLQVNGKNKDRLRLNPHHLKSNYITVDIVMILNHRLWTLMILNNRLVPSWRVRIFIATWKVQKKIEIPNKILFLNREQVATIKVKK